MNDTLIPAAIACIQDLFRGNAGGHDAAHSLRVYRNALRILEEEPGCDTEIVALAALLHDADDHKLFHTEDNANARAFLRAARHGHRRRLPVLSHHILPAAGAFRSVSGYSVHLQQEKWFPKSFVPFVITFRGYCIITESE